MLCQYVPKESGWFNFYDAACEVELKKGLEVRADSDKVKFKDHYKAYLKFLQEARATMLKLPIVLILTKQTTLLTKK